MGMENDLELWLTVCKPCKCRRSAVQRTFRVSFSSVQMGGSLSFFLEVSLNGTIKASQRLKLHHYQWNHGTTLPCRRSQYESYSQLWQKVPTYFQANIDKESPQQRPAPAPVGKVDDNNFAPSNLQRLVPEIVLGRLTVGNQLHHCLPHNQIGRCEMTLASTKCPLLRHMGLVVNLYRLSLLGFQPTRVWPTNFQREKRCLAHSLNCSRNF